MWLLIRACVPGQKQRKTTVRYDKRRYKRRNHIEIMFGRLKDWRRVATRYDRVPEGTLICYRPRGYRHLLVMNTDPMYRHVHATGLSTVRAG